MIADMSQSRLPEVPLTYRRWRRRIARLISAIFNPFFMSITLVVMIGIRSSDTVSEGVKWAVVGITLSTLPIFLIILYLVRKARLDSIFINVRRQRNRIYIYSAICTAAASIVLYLIGAPDALVATFLASLTATVIFLAVNLWWKISVHTAFAASAITVMVLMYGLLAAISAIILLAIGWSRIELEHHTLLQVAAGALLSPIIVVAVFYYLGIIGHGAAI